MVPLEDPFEHDDVAGLFTLPCGQYARGRPYHNLELAILVAQENWAMPHKYNPQE